MLRTLIRQELLNASDECAVFCCRHHYASTRRRECCRAS